MIKIKPIHSLLGVFLLFLVSCQKDSPAPTPIPPNKVPVANAGLSQTITLPIDSISLTGSGTDSDGHVVAYLWSQASGPAATTIVNPGSASTKVKGFKQGTYVFQLMVTDDKGATGVDTATVLVKPSPIVTFTTQPANNPNEIIVLYNNGASQGGGNRPDLPIEAWTSSGNPFTVRGFIKFDLSSIPSNATIISANLYLYSYPSPTLNGNFTDANFGSSNSMLVQQVTSSWDPASTTWNNQPSATTTNQVVVSHTNQSVLDLNLDVTAIVSSMVNGNSNYGFFLKIQNEVIYNSRIFVGSSNTTYTTKYPKLVVVYQ
jgi:hypothetical protein